jgi:hypothetical protein
VVVETATRRERHPFDADVYRCFPSLPVSFSGQSLISHAGVSVLTGFMYAQGLVRLCEDRLGQFCSLWREVQAGAG